MRSSSCSPSPAARASAADTDRRTGCCRSPSRCRCGPDRSLLTKDIVGGITVAALAIPESIGDTKIAGTPVIASTQGAGTPRDRDGDASMVAIWLVELRGGVA